MAQELYTIDWYEYGILFLKKKQFIPLGMVPLSVLSVAKPKGLKRSVVSGKIRIFDTASVAEPEPPGAATLRVEPEPIFYLAGAESRLV